MVTIKKIKVSDLRVGMFVTEPASSWLPTHLHAKNLQVSTPQDIEQLKKDGISRVYIDTEKYVEIKPQEKKKEKASRNEKQFISVKLSAFRVGDDVPVDIFWRDQDGMPWRIIKSGRTFSEEVREVCRGSHVTNVLIPTSQENLFELYRRPIVEEEVQREKIGFSDKYLNPKEVAAYYNFMDNYHSIAPVIFTAGERLDFTIFIRLENSVTPALEKGKRLEEKTLGKWIEEDANLVIRKADKEAYHAYMLKNVKDSKDERKKLAFIRENSRIIVESLAENPRSEKLMHKTKESVTSITDMIINQPTTFYSLIKINNYDYYTFTHSVNVATLSLALAIAAGITKDEGLEELGLGAILHDIGKSQVDSNLINKPGKLTPSEYKTITHHVALGYDMLKGNKAISEIAMTPLLQHHEKLSGKGYPYGLSADKIHTFGRIASIIDIYDALTTQRSYKNAFSPFDALLLLSKNENDYDRELFTLFVHIIQNQEK